MAEAANRAETVLTEVRTSLEQLDRDVKQLQADTSAPNFQQNAKVASELITQALLKVDSVHISKDAAATALREGDRATSRKLAVLLARRKTVVKKLNSLGDSVDTLTTQANSNEIVDQVEELDATLQM